MRALIIFLIFTTIGNTVFTQIDKNWLLIARNSGTYIAVDDYEVRLMGFTSSLGAPVIAPGPTLRATTGDSVKLRLYNLSQGAPHTVHLHGLDVDQPNDGVPHLSFDVEHDSSGYYYFKAPHPGTYLYHCHVISPVHVQGGMYGTIIIDAEDPTETWDGGYAFNKEYHWLTSEVDTIWHNDTIINHEHEMDGMPHNIPKVYDPQYFLVNGAMDFQQEEKGDINVHEGIETKILLRLISIGNFANKYTFPPELNATIISSDGRPLPETEESDTLWIFPGERYQILCNPLTEFIDSVQVDYHELTMGAAKGTQYINVVIEGVFGINEIEQEPITFYPNPSQTYLQFSTPSFSYSIFSISGALIQQGLSSDGLVNTENLLNGNYLIQLNSDSDSNTFFFNKE
ncbi:MAG: FtsP/CotA-like multicopper oxidase with cupredoxin domain [Crocinitomix sp.]|jgi:FtsP/CotA-like multicopper oxidase with cupredoxin domain